MPLTRRNATSLFMLAAAGSASLIEIAPILDALNAGRSLMVVLLLGLAYQVGNGLARKVGGSPKVICAIAGLGLVAWVIPDQILSMQMAAVAALSASLQACRRASSGAADAPSIPVATKRAWRVAGFLVAAILPATYAVSLAAAVLALGAALLASAPASVPPRQVSRLTSVQSQSPVLQEWLWALMVVHQTHYFVYAYAVLYLAFQVSAGSAATAAVAFALGWITYLSAERFWHRFPDQYVFVAGHTFLTACLLGMGLVGENSWITFLLWVLTGFGGGSVYCLVSISTKSGLPTARVERAEDIGHVGGVALAIALVAAGGVGVSGLALAGAALAATAAAALQTMGKRVSAALDA